MMELSDRRTLYVGALTGLQPGTTYYFVAGEAINGMSRERSFRTLPGGDAPFASSMAATWASPAPSSR